MHLQDKMCVLLLHHRNELSLTYTYSSGLPNCSAQFWGCHQKRIRLQGRCTVHGTSSYTESWGCSSMAAAHGWMSTTRSASYAPSTTVPSTRCPPLSTL